MRWSISSQKLNTNTNTFWTFYFAICKNENTIAVLYIFRQVLRCYKVWKAGGGYKFALSVILRAQFVWLYTTSNEKKSWTLYELETVRMNFQQTQQQFSLVLAALSIKRTIEENQANSKKNSAAHNWFVCVTKQTSVMIHTQTNSTLATKAWIEERLKTVVMVPCPNIAKFRRRLLM